MNKREVNIAILYDSALNVNQIQEICAGLEEEGVSFLVQKCDKASNYIELGSKAACMSPLKVGIGIDRVGNICVHHENLKQEEPYLQDIIQNGRKLGKNAARLVKGLPLAF
ncbi:MULTISPECIES: glycerol dehydratase reactivase beta/small subunit family protein [Peribacillus]|uniref:glycerol dehydratase reactivase beta/small subunit family protein n=1 Tax=Peribacillus TaxID=2675229 RepID=UPI001913A204|nr:MULTISPECIES: glycerol dehydratase reactivase beta/small subunit family protein [unclassified Peribacillus]MBK5442855.1 glycerol dehydratase reactivase beta/small subunit family protein [Peribacillus sp. TH24]MBK5462406.1 glycerol dehydratase reactivase beta/small subunit family protein [Peribacillus sp. TH27]MBK5484258.1 glycerol dehydratase reactivase beta/small subunit family protein [Peribacillus sp. TH16]MBK5500556.1 glycerol dehydratase reactivase beta/small subunit family protein [Per